MEALQRLPLLFADLATVETPTTALLKAGVLGACVVALAGVVVYLYRDGKTEIEKREAQIRARDAEIARLQEQRVTLQEAYAKAITEVQKQHVTQIAEAQAKYLAAVTELQSQRVKDAQSDAERMLHANEQMVAALTAVTSTTEATKEAMTEMRTTLRDHSDDLRRLAPRRG